jgi:hypothetical protein
VNPFFSWAFTDNRSTFKIVAITFYRFFPGSGLQMNLNANHIYCEDYLMQTVAIISYACIAVKINTKLPVQKAASVF